MSATITYKGSVIAELNGGQTKKLKTSGKYLEGGFMVEAAEQVITLQEKTVTPTEAVQEVTADEGNDGLSKVTVEAIPDAYIIPSGTLSITENGPHDVANYASVEVAVAPVLEELTITENGEYPPSEGYDGFSKVTVNVAGGGGDSALPVEVATEAEMTTLLASGEVGGVYKYTGESTETYKQSGIYLLTEISGRAWIELYVGGGSGDLPPVGTSLEDCTWEQISAISAANRGYEYFNIGDTKSVHIQGTVGTLGIDTTLYVYIIGFNHNSGVEGTGITFGTFKTADGVDVALCSAYSEADTSGAPYFNMNHWGSYNYGGWAGSDLRYDVLGSTDVAPSDYGAAKTSSVVGYDATATCATNPVANTLMAALPADLRAVLKPITKYTDNVAGGSGKVASNVTPTVDYLPLLATYEIFGQTTYANPSEKNNQARYAYYSTGNSAVKHKHSSDDSSLVYRLRSAMYSYNSFFCVVWSDGAVQYNPPEKSFGLAPIFKV